MLWKIQVKYEAEEPMNPAQQDLLKEKDKKRKTKDRKNVLLEDAFSAVREKVNENNFQRIVIEKV